MGFLALIRRCCRRKNGALSETVKCAEECKRQGCSLIDSATTSFIDEAGVWIVKMVDVSGLQLGSLCSKLEQVCRHH